MFWNSYQLSFSIGFGCFCYWGHDFFDMILDSIDITAYKTIKKQDEYITSRISSYKRCISTIISYIITPENIN